MLVVKYGFLIVTIFVAFIVAGMMLSGSNDSQMVVYNLSNQQHWNFQDVRTLYSSAFVSIVACVANIFLRLSLVGVLLNVVFVAIVSVMITESAEPDFVNNLGGYI